MTGRDGLNRRFGSHHAPAAPARVVVLDDQLLFAEALEIALRSNGHEVSRPVLPEDDRSLQTLARRAARLQPHVALVDLDLAHTSLGMALIPALVSHGMVVVALTGSTDRFRWGEALHHGAAAVIPKIRPLDDILSVISRIVEGRPICAPADRERLVRRWTDREREQRAFRERLDRLTTRERDVLAHLTMGRTVSEIAELRTVSEGTVRTQVKSVLAKLEVSSQLAAVGLARRAGWRP